MKISLRDIRASLAPNPYPGRRDFHGGASKKQIAREQNSPSPSPAPTPIPSPAPTPTPSK
jgi:hypothetical protein